MVERYLRSYVSFQQTDWVDLLPFAEVAYNNTVHSSTGYTPFRIVHGIEFNPIPEWSPETGNKQTPQTWYAQITGLWERVKAALKKAEASAKTQADKKRAGHTPFKVAKVINPVTVQLRLPASLGRIHPVFHCSLLKPAHGRPYPTKVPGPVAGSQYEVQEVLDSRKRYGKLQYLLRWRGYPLSEATWVGERDINAPKLIQAFHRRYPGKPGHDGCNAVYSRSLLSFSGGDMVEGAACQAPGSLTYERGRGDVDGNRPTLASGGRRGGTLGDRPRLGYMVAPPPRAAALTRAAAEHDTGRDDPNGRLAAAPPPRAAAQTETDAKQGTGRGSPNERLAAAEPGFPAAQLLPTAPDVPEWPARQTPWTGDLPGAPAGLAGGGCLPDRGASRQGKCGNGRAACRLDTRAGGCGGGAPSAKGRAQEQGGTFIQCERMSAWTWGREHGAWHIDIRRWEETTPSADFVPVSQ
ncbi:Tf2-1: Tf2-1 [Crotalus adamanteus]|uniref:Tf2-1: Tf2-1 n=1 Tax=Crotalus adamanteus TaxID=8729 RepID=A0AAW1BK30_CROAD